MKRCAGVVLGVGAMLAAAPVAYACDKCGFREEATSPLLRAAMKTAEATAHRGVDQWGGDGHDFINRYAVDNLPDAMWNDGSGNAFSAWRTFLADHSSDADSLRTSGIDTQEAPRHFCDIDSQLAQFPVPFTTVSRDYATYVSAFGRDNGVVMWEGVAEHADALRVAFQTRNWAAAKQAAADVGHYVGDAHSPFHGTENYDGQLSGQNGIHSRHESSLLSRKLTTSDIRTRRSANPIGGSAQIVDDYVEMTFTAITEGRAQTLTILEADLAARGNPATYNTAYYNAMWTAVGQATIVGRVNLACERLADVWYTAWVDAESPDFQLVPKVFPAELRTPVIDGNLQDMGGWANLQTTTTDQSSGASDFADNASELNKLLVNGNAQNLVLGLAGNLAQNHAVVIFLDTVTGGPTSLPAFGPTVVAGLSGTTFASGFAPDYALSIARSATVTVTLTNLATGVQTPLGTGVLSGFPFSNDAGAFAMNNTNTAGVEDRAGRTVGGGQSVQTGIELAIARTLLGMDENHRDVKLLAVVCRNASPVFVSNQFIPGMPIGAVNPGTTTPRNWSERWYAAYQLAPSSNGEILSAF